MRLTQAERYPFTYQVGVPPALPALRAMTQCISGSCKPLHPACTPSEWTDRTHR